MMCSQSKGIGSANISASIYGKIHTIPARFTVLRMGGITLGISGAHRT